MIKFLKAALISTFVILFLGCGVFAAFYFGVFDLQSFNEATPVTAETADERPPVYETEAIDYIETETAETITEDEIAETEAPAEEPIEETDPDTIRIVISAAGDTTLGGDSRWGGYRMFHRDFEENGRDYSYFLANVAHIFAESDMTVVNLEGVLTDMLEPHKDNDFVFRAAPHFAEVLSSSHIDAVTIANNHTFDYFEQGLNDTLDALDTAGVRYFGNEHHLIMEVNGITVGLFGYRMWGDTRENRNNISAAINDLKNRGAQLIIAYYHWGIENEYIPAPYQRAIGRFTLDSGADLVLGSHSHVIQGIEEYNGRYIVYSLANFCFGGNGNPSDMDSFIFQQTFTFYLGELQPENQAEIIPIRVSSVRGRNDFRPTIAQGAEAERILGRIEEYSIGLR